MKRSLIYLFLFCGTLWASSQTAFAQESYDSLQVHEIDGKEYYIHLVEPKNTLYAISRRYAIPVEEIVKANPGADQSLTIGDRLLIPLKSIKKRDLNESLEIDGNYLVHQAKKRNTLYSIAKEYNVEVKDIIAENPELKEGLKVGQEIRIPVEKIKREEANEQYAAAAEESKFITHQVLPKETLYSLAKSYEVELDSLIKLNDGLIGGLKIGQRIRIPILKSVQDSLDNLTTIDSTEIKTQYAVALLLPFYLDLLDLEDKADTVIINDPVTMRERSAANDEMDRLLFSKAHYAIEFLQGFEIAADSLKNLGLSLRLHVYDTANDSAQVAQILEKPEMKDMDLIVGPLFLKNFLLAADFAKENGINIVSPVKQSNKILLGNSFVSKVAASDPVMLKRLAHFMVDSLRAAHTLMVLPDHIEDRQNAELLEREYKKRLHQIEDTNYYTPPETFLWTGKNFKSLLYKLKGDSIMNYLIVPSERQAFVTSMLTMLNGELKNYRITVIGMDAWENYDNISPDYFQRMNVHLMLSEFIDRKDERVQGFEEKFYGLHEALPKKFAYLGFDVGYYYLSMLKDYGVNFNVMFLGYQEQMLGRSFSFYKTGIESGFENHGVHLVRYQDYERKKIF